LFFYYGVYDCQYKFYIGYEKMIETLELLPTDVTPTDRVIKLKPFQDGFIFSEQRYPALVSAWGTGKTMSLIEKVRLASEEYPNNLILVLRKEFVDLRDSTIKDWNLNTGIIVGSSRDAIFPNGSIVMFRHAGELLGNNLNNMNLGGFAIEQGEELDNDDVFFKLQGRLRRNGVKRFGCVIANTNGHNWIYNLWKVGNDPEYPLFEATSFDNEDILPADTISDWRKLEIKSPKTYRRFVMNSWDDTDAVDLVIDPEWVRWSKGKSLWMTDPIRRIVSIDVARYGDDKTVFYAIEYSENGGYKTISKQTHEKKNIMEVVGLAVLFAKNNGIKDYCVDEIGVGAGVVDRLKELNHKVIGVNSSESAGDSEKYYNRRAEVYGSATDAFRESKVSLIAEDTELYEQLSWAKYKVIKSNGQIQIEAKEDIKKRYGRSPDNADAFLNGLWAVKKVMPISNSETSESVKVGWRGGHYTPPWAVASERETVMI
jgi:hypothetical protein